MWITWITPCITLFLHIFMWFLQWITFGITLPLCLLFLTHPDILCMLYISLFRGNKVPCRVKIIWSIGMRINPAAQNLYAKNSYHPKTIAVFTILIFNINLENSSYADRTSVIYIRELDTTGRCTCVNDRAATNINSNVTTVAYNISRLCVGKTYFISNTS